jgi:RES domain-containing protein
MTDHRPPGPASQHVGQAWVDAGETLACAVPSVVIPYSGNVMLNPAHPAMADLTVHEPEAFPVDERLRAS